MNDSIYEHIVPRKAGPAAFIIKVAVIVLLALLLFIAFPFIQTFAVILVAIIGFIAYQFLFIKLNVEYEYTLLNHDIDIDAIYSRQKRKRQLSFDFQQAEIIAPKNSPRLRSINPEKIYDFSSRTDDSKVYAIFINVNKKRLCVYIEPDQDMLNHMKPWMGTKMHLD